MSKTAIIVGAGIAGIATAIRLATKGAEVRVFDRNPFAGGKLHAFEKEGYRFDFGPSLFTMPQLVDDLFRLAGKNPEEYFTYSKLDVTCRYFYEDGTRLKAYADEKLFDQEATSILGTPHGTIKKHFDHSYRIYRHTAPFFLQKPITRLRTLFDKRIFASLLNIPRFDLFSSMNRANEKRLKEPHLVQLFNRYATYNGSDPYRAPGILNVIPSLENHFGAFYPKGGMHSITTSLVKLATDLGVQFHLNTAVEEITIEQGRASGIKTSDKSVYTADTVVCNADMWFAYHQLLKDLPKPALRLKQERSSSALVFYWGINAEFKELGLHNILFSADYKAEFNALFKETMPVSDPTVYINITSKLTPTDAPTGCENWFVMINMPKQHSPLPKDVIQKIRTEVIEKINRVLKTDLEALIVSETVTTPETIETKTGSYGGSLYGTSSNNALAAFLRHPNDHSVKDLYFCGGSVHPGGGIPLCLWSAEIVAQHIVSKS
jgi:phytoene desaturase